MKKYLWLAVFTLLGVLTGQAVPGAVLASAPAVQTVTLVPQEVTVSLFCTGRITVGDRVPVTTELPVVARPVVAVGDAVDKGQTLAEVDAAATLRELAALADLPPEAVSLAGAAGQNEVYYAGQTLTLPRQIVAPADGVIRSLNIPHDALCGTDGPVAVLTGGAGTVVTAPVGESQIARVAVGQPVKVTGSGFAGVYTGRVYALADTAVQPLGGGETAVEVTFQLDRPDEALRSGFTARVEILVEQGDTALLVPFEALCRVDGQDCVYLAGQRRAVVCPVTLGRETLQGVEVLSGLKPGDEIVADPAVLTGSGGLIRREEKNA